MLILLKTQLNSRKAKEIKQDILVIIVNVNGLDSSTKILALLDEI